MFGQLLGQLMDMSPSFEASAKQELGSRMDKVLVLKQAKVAPDKVKFDLEFILRGTNETMANSVRNCLQDIRVDSEKNKRFSISKISICATNSITIFSL